MPNALPIMGPLMTRTVLNWSELVDQYRGRCIKKEPRLKKWSEMDDLDAPQGRYITKHTICSDEFTSESEFSAPKPLASIQFDQTIEEDAESELEENADTDTLISEEEPATSSKLGKKIPLSELLYDVIGQDTESIPSLAESNQLESTTPNRLSEHDSLLIDLLELNLRNGW